MKKVLSVVLAVVMLLGCFSMLSYAVVNDAVLKIELKPTSSNYNKGDVVTFEALYETSPDLVNLGAAFYFSVGYDSSVFELIEDVSAKPNFESSTTCTVAGYPVENNITPSLSWVGSYGTESLTTKDTAKGWDKVLFISMTPTGTCDDDYSTQKASFAFKLKLKSDASATGSYKVGITDFSIQNSKTEIDETDGSLFGPSGTDFGFTTNNIFETVDGTVSMGSVVSGPSVVKVKAQAKFDGTSVATPGNMTMRVISKITDADWDAYFSNTATGVTTGNNRIESVGMVAYMGAAFDLATAKDVVKGTATNADYKVGTTTYISKASDTADATFGTLMMLGSEQPTSDITYVGFVKYIDSTGATAYAFYDAQQVASVSSNYNTIVNGYPFA